MKNFGYLLTVVCVLVLSSCNKDFNTEQESTDQKILHFDSYSHMQEELSSVLKMTTAEKANWATKKGFTSFGVEADLFYEKINPESFKSEEEIIQFVNKSKYLEVRTDDNNEKSVEIVDGDNPIRYFANDEKCFTVGDEAVKIIGRNSVSTCIDNLAELKKIVDISQVQDNPEFSVKTQKTISLKSLASSCSDLTPDTKTTTVGDYRISMEIWASYYYTNGMTKVENGCKIKSQKRTILWFAYTTFIRYKIDQIVKYHYYNSSQIGGVRLMDGGAVTQSTIEVIFAPTADYYNYNPGIYWQSYDNTAYFDDSDDEPRVDLRCGL